MCCILSLFPPQFWDTFYSVLPQSICRWAGLPTKGNRWHMVTIRVVSYKLENQDADLSIKMYVVAICYCHEGYGNRPIFRPLCGLCTLDTWSYSIDSPVQWSVCWGWFLNTMVHVPVPNVHGLCSLEYHSAVSMRLTSTHMSAASAPSALSFEC